MKNRVLACAVILVTALQGCVPLAPRERAPLQVTAALATPEGASSAAAPGPPAAESEAPGAAPAPPAEAPKVEAPTPGVVKPATARPVVGAPAQPAQPERYVSLNFDNADISIVIQTIAELLHLNYIVSPAVRGGKVTIQTADKLPVSALPTVLDQILSVNNFTAVRDGDFLKIVPATTARMERIKTLSPGTDVEGRGLVTKIVQLEFISPGEVVKVLTPFKSQAGLYQAHEPTRLLLLTEIPEKIDDLLRIIEVLDVDSFASIQVELYPVKYAGVEDLARELTQIVTLITASAGRGKTLFRIVPVPQMNGIMVFSGETGLAERIREWITKLDQPTSEANERIFVYPLAHASAESLAGVLEKVFRRESTKATVKSSTPAQPAAAASRAATQAGQPAVPTPVAPAAAIGTAAAASIAVSSAPVVIVADKDTNALIIQTTSWYYPVVEATIRKLDIMPKQVLIEVLIAEISLDDDNQFGIQWALKGQGSVGVGGDTLNLQTGIQNVYSSAGVAPVIPGFSLFVAEANRLSAVLQAYSKDSRINVLSTPHIFATDNKEAKIDIGQEVPILKRYVADSSSTTTTTTTTTNDVEYRSTGVILTVTPHINEGGFVTLDLQQEVSEAQTNTIQNIDSPIIRKRTAKTTMVVKDDQTLVIGGLIQQKQDRSREGIPGLSKIPIIGYLFGTTTAKVSKTELVLLITPRIVTSAEEGDRITREVQDRVLTLKPGLDRFRKAGEGQTP